MAANDDDVFIRPRGRVLLAATPAPGVRWRDRLRRAATTEASRLEYELSLIAQRAIARGWPVAAPGGEGEEGVETFVGLRVGWIAWFEHGVERIGPDWSVARDGRVMAEDDHEVSTDELAVALVRLDACDGLPAAQARAAFDAQVDLVRRHVANCLAHLESRLLEGPPLVPPVVPPSVFDVAGVDEFLTPLERLRRGRGAVSPAGDERSSRRPWGKRRSA